MQLTTDKHIIEAYHSAAKAESDYAIAVIHCACLLREKRAALEMTCHSGKSYHKNDRTKPESAQFNVWLDSVGIPSRTAYRWIESAERVLAVQLKINVGQPVPVVIDVDSEAMPLSRALLANPEDLTGKAKQLNQSFFAFMRDKTLAEAVRACVDGDSPAHRISRAGHGKVGKHSGGSGDRKDIPRFALEKLEHLNTFLNGWAKLPAGQRAELLGIFKAAVSGGEISFRTRAVPTKFDLWPEEVCEVMIEALRLRLREARR